MGKRLRISRGGQVSVPAAVRNRWVTRTVVAEDRGDHLVLRPAPDDPIEAAAGAFADEIRAESSEDAHRAWREEELAAEELKARRRRR